MHYLVTGHTGFKGAWLVLWLTSRGHQVSGLALDSLPGSLFDDANLSELLHVDARVDIRNPDATASAVREIAADVVFHLAAQPLVRRSYNEPRLTVETNVLGTLNVIEAAAATPSTQAMVVVTTDKVYRNINQAQGYVETDPLGGSDPYSASKAMADILAQSWIASFPGVPTAIARAGNVIGGGDVSSDRLLPDLINSFTKGQVASIRYPNAVRPWQHVLDCLHGYVTLSDALLTGRGRGEWNFGPGEASFVTVRNLAEVAAVRWGEGASWRSDEGDHPHEAGLLALDASKAEQQLDWHNRLDFADSVAWTIDWHRARLSGESAREITESQIRAFKDLA